MVFQDVAFKSALSVGNFSRPSGTRGKQHDLVPTVETVGYSRMSLRDTKRMQEHRDDNHCRRVGPVASVLRRYVG